MSTEHSVAGKMDPEAASRVTRRAAMASVAVAAALIALKGWAWIVSGSVAMLSSLADSTLDLAASLFTYYAVKFAASPPDREHRYGHGKAESFAGLFQAGLITVSSALIAVEALKRFIGQENVSHGPLAIMVMCISILLTAGLIQYQSRAVAMTGSVATKGDRAHYAADLGANVAVILGIAFAYYFGIAWADALAGLLVAGYLGWNGWVVAREASDNLMDRELPNEDRQTIRDLAMETGDIRAVHDLRTRASGPFVHIQFHADLDPALPLKTAHEIVVAAEKRIRSVFPAADVIIHPDPQNAAEPHGHEYFAEGAKASGATVPPDAQSAPSTSVPPISSRGLA
jgi:cation diffusion facilitator family transporter